MSKKIFFLSLQTFLGLKRKDGIAFSDKSKEKYEHKKSKEKYCPLESLKGVSR